MPTSAQDPVTGLAANVDADLAVSAHDVSVRFAATGHGGEPVTAVEHASFSLRTGEVLCLVGPSGCGKSTLLNVAAGLLPSRRQPNVEVTGDMQVLGAPPDVSNPQVGYMFQGDTLLPWRTALQNVMLPLRMRGVADPEAQAMELLKRAGLQAFATAFPKQLSGGMRKRVQLVQVLAQDPAVVLMDEPFGALDAQTRTLMQQEFLTAWERNRKSIIFVTHDLTEAILLGDRILCMTRRPGKIKCEFPVPFERPRAADEITGRPGYVALLEELWATIRDEADEAMRETSGGAP